MEPPESFALRQIDATLLRCRGIELLHGDDDMDFIEAILGINPDPRSALTHARAGQRAAADPSPDALGM
jgi:hypothetical protein